MGSFVIVQVRSGARVYKSWYGCRLDDGFITISDLFAKLRDGEIDSENPILELEGATTVDVFAGKSKDAVNIRLDKSLPVHMVVSSIGMFIEFKVNLSTTVSTSAPVEKNGFTFLMNNAQDYSSLPDKYSDLNGRNKLQNEIISWLSVNQIGWSRAFAKTSGKTFVEDLAGVLWYIDGHHDGFRERSCHIPSMFNQFQGFNVVTKTNKKRKRDIDNLKGDIIATHSSTLFTIAACSYMKRTAWLSIRKSILELAQCLKKYGSFLDKQLKRTTINHNKLVLTDVDEWKILTPKLNGTPSEMAHFHTLHEALRVAKNYETIFLNDFCPHDRKRRFDYLKTLFSPYNCTIYTYTGTKEHLHFIWKMDICDDDSVRMQKNQELKSSLSQRLPTFHSRAMRKQFISKFGTVVKTNTAFLREMYRTLVGDSSSASNLASEEIDSRVKEFFELEDTDLVIDLRVNNGRPADKYDLFLKECQNYIEGIETAVDDRHHDLTNNAGEVVTHLATAMNARVLYETVVARLPENTPIPSLQWLRYQFWPRNACQSRTHTGKLNVKYMVQARQLRLDHPDAHYASAIFRYQKEFACKFREYTDFFSCDDKHTVKVGEPNFPVAAVDRGKEVLCRYNGTHRTMRVADHDFTKSSITPSVHMAIDTPENIEGSFYRGEVHVGIKDNVFEASSAQRHACELNEIFKNLERIMQPLLLLYTDGGPDHNITFIKTQLSLIALFFENDLDLLCAVRSPPHHSWKNPVERIMSILNIALNSVGMMRSETKNFEDQMKSCSSLKDLRNLADLVGFKEEYNESLNDVRELLESLFVKLKLKDEYFKVFKPSSEESIKQLYDTVLSKFGIPFGLRKQDLSKYPELSEFLATHCKITHYMFSVKKCGENCKFGCKPPRLPSEVFDSISHLPDPVPGTERDHYRSFNDSYRKVTSEEHRPSLQEAKKRGNGMPFSPSAQFAKNTDTFIECVECGRSRCLYSKKKLTTQQKNQLKNFLDDHDYICGATLSSDDDDDDDDNDFAVLDTVFVNTGLTCRSVMEKPFFNVCKDLVCFQCGSKELVSKTNEENYTLCQRCISAGIKSTKKASRKVTPKGQKSN